MLGAADQHVRLDADLAQLARPIAASAWSSVRPRAIRNGTSVTWMNMQSFGPTSSANWRIASRNGRPSMSPVVPPISVIARPAARLSARRRCALDLVRDVRDHLHGLAEVVAAPLLLDHRL
jgi:hypothetical protein